MTGPEKATGPDRANDQPRQDHTKTEAPIVAPAIQYCNQGVMEALRGQSAALEAIQDARSGTANPDLLHARLQAVILSGSQERLRGFLRTIQKALEADSVTGVQHG